MTSENDNPQIVYAMLRELLDAMKAFRDASLTPKQLRGVMTRAETVLETVGAPRQSEQWMKEAAHEQFLAFNDWITHMLRFEQEVPSSEALHRQLVEIIAKHAPKEPTAPPYKIPSCESGSITVSDSMEKGADSQQAGNLQSTSGVSAPDDFFAQRMARARTRQRANSREVVEPTAPTEEKCSE